MEAAVERLHAAFPDYILPLDPAGLAELERTVPGLPPEVSRLYCLTGGMRFNRELPAYPMPPAEVAATVKNFRKLQSGSKYDKENAAFGDASNCLLLFTDGNSNYLGLHLTAPFAPRGFALDHEVPSLEPKFKSLAKMLEAVVEAPGDEDCWVGNMPACYPVANAAAAGDDDRALSLRLLAEYQRAPDNARAEAFAAMQLSHPDDMEAFCHLLDSPDMWVAENMCRLIGFRRYQPAIGRMVEAAATLGGNRIFGAIVALRDWQDDEARKALTALRARVGEGYAAYFRTA